MFRNAQSQLEAVFESVSDGIGVQDRNLKWVFANSAAARLCGYDSAEEFLRATVEENLARFEIFDEFGKPFDFNKLPARRIFRGETGNVQAIIRARNRITGVENWSVSTAYPIPDETGAARFAVCVFRDITATKTIEEKLRMQSRVLESMREGVSLSDENGIMVHTNPSLDRMFGYEAGELIGKPVTILNAYAPEENETRVKSVIEHLKSNGAWVGEWHNRRKDGSTFYTRSQITSLDINDKLHFVCVQDDVTEERLTRAAARANELRFRALAESMMQLVWTTGPDGTNEYVNDNCIEYTGIPMTPGNLDHWTRAIHPEDAQSAFNAWTRSVSTGENFECEYRLRRYNGEYRWFLGRAAPVRDSDGNITGWVGTATDIEDQKAAEADQRFLSEITASLTSSLDYKTRMQSAANLAIGRFKGWCHVSILNAQGELQTETLAHSDPAQIQRAWEAMGRFPPKPGHSVLLRVLSSGKPEHIPAVDDEYLKNVATNDEHLRTLRGLAVKSIIATPLKDGDQTYGVMVLSATENPFSDVDFRLAQLFAERLSMALVNARHYSDAKAAIRARDDLLSVTSHELKTPITTLKLQLQIAQRLLRAGDGEFPREKLAATVEGSIRQVNRLTSLIENLLDFSRQADGKIQFQFEQVDLSGLMHETLDRLSEQIQASRSEFTSKIAPGVTIDADPLRLDQVIVNLVTNALKYGERSPIDVSLENREDVAVIEVRDKGMGIPKDMQSRIFERFERGVSSQNISGFGLGLYITKQIVEAHQGRISVESDTGSGTAFRVEIPRVNRIDA